MLQEKIIILFYADGDDYYVLLAAYLSEQYPSLKVKSVQTLTDLVALVEAERGKELFVLYTPESFSESENEKLWSLADKTELQLSALHSWQAKLLLSNKEKAALQVAAYKLSSHTYLFDEANLPKINCLFRFIKKATFNQAFKRLLQLNKQSFVLTALNYPFSQRNNNAIYELAQRYLAEGFKVIYLPLVETWEQVSTLSTLSNSLDAANAHKADLGDLLSAKSWQSKEELDLAKYLSCSTNGNYLLALNAAAPFKGFDFNSLTEANWLHFWESLLAYIKKTDEKSVIICQVNLHYRGCTQAALKSAEIVYLSQDLKASKNDAAQINVNALQALLKEVISTKTAISYLE